MNKVFTCSFFVLGILLSGGVWAQIPNPQGNFKGWEHVSTEFFDIQYTPGNEDLAIKVGQYAERARLELTDLFDFRADLRYTLVYFNNSFELMASNIPLDREVHEPGTYRMPERREYVINPGDSRGLYQEVKKKVSDLILEEFAFGNRLSTVIQSQILLNNPTWFWQGLSEYVASGWTFEDEMWISSMRNEDVLEPALEGQGTINRILRKSIWQYIVSEYGEEKISEIIYLVNVSNSIESGIISVLGIQLPTFSERWREYLKDLTSLNASDRTGLESLGELTDIELKKGTSLTSFDYNESENLLALQLHKKGDHQAFIYNVSEKSFEALPIQSGYSINGAERLDFSLPISWSPSGASLATMQLKGRRAYLVFYDLETQELTRTELLSPIRWVTGISWMQDEDYVVLSAIDGRSTNLYTYSRSSENFTPITEDPYDNIQPAVSVDDKYVFFASNRPNSTAKVDKADLPDKLLAEHFDLFMFDLTDRNGTITRLTNTETVDELYPHPLTSFEIGYLSDESGIRNFYKINVFLREFKTLTNLNQSVAKWDGGENQAFFSSPVVGKEQIVGIPMEDLRTDRIPETTLLRDNYNLKFRAKKKEEVKEQRKTQPTRTEAPTTSERPETNASQDSSADRPAVRYYLFDEGDQYEVSRPKIPSRIRNSRQESIFAKKTLPPLRDIVVEDGVLSRSKWGALRTGWGLTYDPIAKFGLEMQVSFADQLRNHRIDARVKPFLNLKNWEGTIRYSYLPHKVDFYAEVGTWSRRYRQESIFFPQDSLIFRFDRFEANIGAIYPLTSRIAVEATAGFFRLQRTDQKLLRRELVDAEDNALRGSVNLYYDNTEMVEGYPFKGTAVTLGMDNFYSFDSSAFQLNIARMELRHYIPLKNKIVLAARVQAALNLFDEADACKFAPDGSSIASSRCQYYLGGLDDRFLTLNFEKSQDLTITGNPINLDLYGFHFQDFITPIRGFWFNSRVGNKYVLGNFELRLPVSRLLTTSLNSGPLFNVDLIPFFDAGTIWSEGNPFTQKNPTDTRIVGSAPVTVELKTLKSPFLFTVGTGLRANLIGYSVRLDMAWGIEDNTLQKPMLHASFGKNF
ncbi:MAG: BamA/TamA family outer membrane protein [Bacteroidota bacterium]